METYSQTSASAHLGRAIIGEEPGAKDLVLQLSLSFKLGS